jgi:prepilin-type N-terminal cleavage/methylation domain-containing protein
MKTNERGFTLIEVIIGIAILAMVVFGASITIIQVGKLNPSMDASLAIKNDMQNADYWITRDAQMARSITTQDLPYNDFLILTWVEFTEAGNPIDHTVTYFFDESDGETGILKRNHSSSTGENQDTLIARYIRYDPGDPDNTSWVSYENGRLTAKLIAFYGDNSETNVINVTPCKIPIG